MAQGNFVTLTQLTRQLAVHKSNVSRDLRKWEKAIGRNATASKRVAGKRVCVLTQTDADEFVAWRSGQYCLTVDKLSTVATRLETIVHQLVDLVDELRRTSRNQHDGRTAAQGIAEASTSMPPEVVDELVEAFRRKRR